MIQYIRKVIYHCGRPTQHVLVKGHFLMVANELVQGYEGAKFFIIVRELLDQFRSTINFLRLLIKKDV